GDYVALSVPDIKISRDVLARLSVKKMHGEPIEAFDGLQDLLCVVRIQAVPCALERAQRADVSFPHASGQFASAAVAVRYVLVHNRQCGASFRNPNTVERYQDAIVGCVQSVTHCTSPPYRTGILLTSSYRRLQVPLPPRPV